MALPSTLIPFAANALVFLLMGVTITLPMFEERWLTTLNGIGGVLIARAIGSLAPSDSSPSGPFSAGFRA